MQKLYSFLFPKKLTRKIAYWMIASLTINFLIAWFIPIYLSKQQEEKVLKDLTLSMLLLNEHSLETQADTTEGESPDPLEKQQAVQKTIDNLAQVYPQYYVGYYLSGSEETSAHSPATPSFLTPPSSLLESMISKPEENLIVIGKEPYYYKTSPIFSNNAVIGHTWAITQASQNNPQAILYGNYILLIAIILACFFNYFIWKHFIRLKEELANLARVATDPESKRLSMDNRFAESLPEIKPLLSMINQFHRSANLKAIGQFASNVVHEIKNPLTTMRGFSQLLQAKLTDEQSISYIKYIIDEIDRLNKLAIDFLRLTKSSDPKPEWISIRKLFFEMNKILEGKILTDGLHLTIDMDREDLYALSDPNLLRQVMLNLLLNAMQAMEQQDSGKIVLRARLQDQEVLLEVIDTGPGIPTEQLEKIFEPFFTTKETGTGLGLSFSKQTIEKQGGEITVHSELGLGTTFCILLPGAPEIGRSSDSSLQLNVG